MGIDDCRRESGNIPCEWALMDTPLEFFLYFMVNKSKGYIVGEGKNKKIYTVTAFCYTSSQS